MFTEQQLVTLVNSYRSPEDAIAGRRVLQEFMLSRSACGFDNENLPTLQEVFNLLKDFEHVTFFIMLILYNPRIVRNGYARAIRNDSVFPLNSFKTNGFSLQLNAVHSRQSSSNL